MLEIHTSNTADSSICIRPYSEYSIKQLAYDENRHLNFMTSVKMVNICYISLKFSLNVCNSG
ncbi:hypothetical protein D3C78_950130 [compost metagenome]